MTALAAWSTPEGGPGTNPDGCVQFVGADHPRDQPVAGRQSDGLRGLAFARLEQQVAARC